MDQGHRLSRFELRREMRTPRAAAIAGIIFSVLLATAIALLHVSLASQEALRQDWFAVNAWRIKLNKIVPFFRATVSSWSSEASSTVWIAAAGCAELGYEGSRIWKSGT